MKQSTRLSLLAVTVALFLAGCTNIPLKLGISNSEWSKYSPDEQKRLLANYKKFAQEQKNAVKKKKKDVINSIFLVVNIHDGQVMMPPFISWQKYKPVRFTIFRGQCRNVILQQPSNKKVQIELGVCFRGNAVYFDPSRYDLDKQKGPIAIYFSPLWLSGFSYKEIDSSGYARLKNVTIEIKQEDRLS